MITIRVSWIFIYSGRCLIPPNGRVLKKISLSSLPSSLSPHSLLSPSSLPPLSPVYVLIAISSTLERFREQITISSDNPNFTMSQSLYLSFYLSVFLSHSLSISLSLSFSLILSLSLSLSFPISVYVSVSLFLYLSPLHNIPYVAEKELYQTPQKITEN